MGVPLDDYKFVIEDLAEELREQEGFEDFQASIDREGAMYCFNQNSREPVTEPDELLPLWKILYKAGGRLDILFRYVGRRKLLHVPGR